MKTVTAYSCEFCPSRRPFKTKASAKRHETICYRNAALKPCATCKHFEWVDEEWHSLEFGEDISHPYRRPDCEVDALPGNGQDDPYHMTTHCDKWEAK